MDTKGLHSAPQALREWLDELAEPVPAPGGGAASAVVLAIGASVTAMTAGYAPLSAEREQALALSTKVRVDALELADRDAAASAALIAAFRMPDGAAAEAERAHTLQEATWASLAIAQTAAPLAAALAWLDVHGDPRLRPDVVVAGHTMAAAVRAAAATALSNMSAAADVGVDPLDIDRMTAAHADAARLAAEFDDFATRVTVDLSHPSIGPAGA